MHVVVLFSGGKDSVYTSFLIQQQGFDISLLSIVPQEYSMMFHHQNVQWTKLQAEAMDLKNKYQIAKANDDEWFYVLKKKLKQMKAEGVATGAYASEYQRQRIDMLAEELGIPSYAPLWHRQFQEELSTENRFEIKVIGVSAEGLTEKHLCKPYSDIISIVGPSLEGGEAETFVLDAPFFKKKIVIDKYEKTWDNIRGSCIIKEAHLEGK